MDVTATFATDHPLLISPPPREQLYSYGYRLAASSPVSFLFPSVLLKCAPSYLNRLVLKGELVN